jgi:protein-S-isoprenylcysteine O-methyltransferase Ste14
MTLQRWLKSTSNRTFVVYPVLVFVLEAVMQGGWPRIVPWFAPLLAWGYLQYRLVGNYRLARGGGGPGMSVPPTCLVTTGPYRFMRNPMYLGHLVFMLVLVFASWPAAALLGFHVPWFNDRAQDDEAKLRRLFGAEYEAYAARVKRWLPGVR